MGDILTGFVKGLSGFMPQDDPDVKIFNAQTEMKELSEKEEKIYARLGRQVYETDGGENYPEIKAELDLLVANKQAAESRLQAACDEKAALERAEAEERACREADEQAHSCPNCGAYNPEGTNFCQECGTRLTQPAPQPSQQQAYAPPSQPAYAQPQPGYVAPAGDPNAPLPPGSKYEPITTGGYIGIFLLMLLPLINLILLIIWACGGCQKVNKANFARAMLIMMIIGSVLSLLIFFAVRMLFGSEIDSLMEASGDLLK
ncbi:zinc ribbon domain-containing protein [Parabacteroides distasonis]|uniref:zinc ribbon domain-containing protein n=1 Tax=Parabacteroides distasonis TaxID=823 RepID=UPI0039B3A2D3